MSLGLNNLLSALNLTRKGDIETGTERKTIEEINKKKLFTDRKESI